MKILVKKNKPRAKKKKKSEFVERFPELSLFFKAYSPLDSEMICIFPLFLPLCGIRKGNKEIFSYIARYFIKKSCGTPFCFLLLSERKYSLWY